MRFFINQSEARKRTRLLLFLYPIGASLVLLSAWLIVSFCYELYMSEFKGYPFIFSTDMLLVDELPIVVWGFSLLLFGPSLFAFWDMQRGGSYLAVKLGGKLLDRDVKASEEKKLWNIVEEMSIAASVPMPQIYLFEEEYINAFAAGTVPENSVIGITRGALALLTREQLEAVIAHEFSHILNGDVRLNTLMASLLTGLNLFGLIGERVIRDMRYSNRSSSSNQSGMLPILIFGASFKALGIVGVFASKVIQAAVSRQREFLADASAVQFTRNPDAVASVLKVLLIAENWKAGLGVKESRYSYMFFDEMHLPKKKRSLFATHPTLEDRLDRIQPHWRDDFSKEQEQVKVKTEERLRVIQGQEKAKAEPNIEKEPQL